MKPVVQSIDVPEFGDPGSAPTLSPEIYQARLAAARDRMKAAGLDRMVVYADREHSANLAYLTGFDPRFEEALLILGPDGSPALLAGNECVGLAAAAPLAVRAILFQDFSLPGQPRGDSAPLRDLLSAEGIGPGSNLGIVAWKVFASPKTIEAPAYIVETLRDLTGRHGKVVNAAELFMNATDGLRVINEADQLAAFEHAACCTSSGIRRLLTGLTPGMTEREAARLLGWSGDLLSCHLMLSSGSRAPLGLVSPGDKLIERGAPFTVAYGLWGALNCRAGFLVEDEAELPADIGNYVEKLVAPYFAAVVRWYRALHVGVTGGALYEAVREVVEDPFFGVKLNPGHQLHLDEWVNSPIFDGSKIALRSGMALQCDIIPATGTRYFTTNIEDGLALADEALRNELAGRFPAMWQRVDRRRTFMKDALGIDLHPDVLPFSNFPACLPPFLLAPDRIMTVAGAG